MLGSQCAVTDGPSVIQVYAAHNRVVAKSLWECSVHHMICYYGSVSFFLGSLAAGMGGKKTSGPWNHDEFDALARSAPRLVQKLQLGSIQLDRPPANDPCGSTG
jgi:hypothetical protein